MISRAQRRAQRATIKARPMRRTSWHCIATVADQARHIGIAIDTPKRCSCEMCGNPRVHFGDRSMQERRHDWY